MELNYSTSITMHTMHPKRVLSENDMNISLKDLGLAPTATILVLPVIFIIISFFFLKVYIYLFRIKILQFNAQFKQQMYSGYSQDLLPCF